MNKRKRIGIIGCGAVTEVCHLPAAKQSPDIEISALVDLNIDRARSLGTHYGIPCFSDYTQIFDLVDGVIVATPHYLHAPVAIECVQRRIPVLIEKPLALSTAEACRLIETAQASQTPVQAGYMYRFCAGAHTVKQALECEWLGRVTRFELECGTLYSWPAVSGFYWSKERAGGGVLVDTGSHMLDLLLWWFGEVQELDYRDDCMGGVEADCELSMTLGDSNRRIEGTVVLSRLRQLTDVVRITGDRFSMEYDLGSAHTVRIWPTEASRNDSTFTLAPSSPQRWIEVYANQLTAFGASIGGQSPVVSAESVLPTVALIERCYNTRKRLNYDWLQSEPIHSERRSIRAV